MRRFQGIYWGGALALLACNSLASNDLQRAFEDRCQSSSAINLHAPPCTS
jgi:hypothetical protein